MVDAHSAGTKSELMKEAVPKFIVPDLMPAL